MAHSPLGELLERLHREREEVQAICDKALAAVDGALPGDLPAWLDPESLKPLSVITPPDPLASLSGWRRRLAGFVWRLVGPMLQQQQQFNDVVAMHVARPLIAFQRYLQEVRPLVEAKQRDAALTTVQTTVQALSALADEIAKRWESMVAREQRYEARVSALTRDGAELRTAIASLQQLSHATKRELERVLAAPARGTAAIVEAAGVATAPVAAGVPSLEAYKYVGFEDQFRGSVEQIRARLADYLPLFEGGSDVLDVGCGRGEFLRLLAECGVKARGIDINHEMVETCRSRGLDVVEGDAVEYLAAVADGTLGGLFAAQVVEHLEPERLMRLLDVAISKLRPGSRVVLETINPACWAAFFHSYIRDLTHVRPIHPETLKYLLQATGYHNVEIRYRAPYPETARLQPIPMPKPSGEGTAEEWRLVDFADTFNSNVAKLNAELFTHLDYAAIATVP
jgi:SAM-dependent methyltransferase